MGNDVSRHSGRKSLVARLRGLSGMLATLVLAGCATTYPMMPTPTLYTGARARPLFTSAPADVQTPPLDLLFVTDRAPATGGDAPDPYTADRSRSMAFGSTTVLFGEGLTWDTLVRDSLVFPRRHPLDLALGPTTGQVTVTIGSRGPMSPSRSPTPPDSRVRLVGRRTTMPRQ